MKVFLVWLTDNTWDGGGDHLKKVFKTREAATEFIYAQPKDGHIYWWTNEMEVEE